MAAIPGSPPLRRTMRSILASVLVATAFRASSAQTFNAFGPKGTVNPAHITTYSHAPEAYEDADLNVHACDAMHAVVG